MKWQRRNQRDCNHIPAMTCGSLHRPWLKPPLPPCVLCYSPESMPRRDPTSQPSPSATAVDLFCGAGGLTRGLLDAGIAVAAGYDIDPLCEFPYEHNNPGAKFKKQSVKDVTAAQLEAHYPPGHTRILVGCAPCQPFSKYTQGTALKKKEDWPLLNEFARLVQTANIDIVSMENVAELQRHGIFASFLKTLSKAGFHFATAPEKQVVYCPDYGIPQVRKRLVVVASRLGPIELIPPTHKDSPVKVEEAIAALPALAAGETDPLDPLHRCSRLSRRNLARIRHSAPGGTWRDWPRRLIADCHKKKSGKTYPAVYGRMEWDKPSPTITTQFFGFGNGRFGHPKQDRAISLREGAILQSFPEDYQFVEQGGDYCFKTIGRLIGNAVPVRLGEAVGETIKRHLEKIHA